MDNSQKIRPDTHVAVFWPCAWGRRTRKRALRLLEGQVTIRREREVDLSRWGVRNLLLALYPDFEWIGTAADHYAGTWRKVDWVYLPGATTWVCLLENPNGVDMVALKAQLRELFCVQQHSLHITDTMAEAQTAYDLLFSDEGVAALNDPANGDYPGRAAIPPHKAGAWQRVKNGFAMVRRQLPGRLVLALKRLGLLDVVLRVYHSVRKNG